MTSLPWEIQLLCEWLNKRDRPFHELPTQSSSKSSLCLVWKSSSLHTLMVSSTVVLSEEPLLKSFRSLLDSYHLRRVRESVFLSWCKKHWKGEERAWEGSPGGICKWPYEGFRLLLPLVCVCVVLLVDESSSRLCTGQVWAPERHEKGREELKQRNAWKGECDALSRLRSYLCLV